MDLATLKYNIDQDPRVETLEEEGKLIITYKATYLTRNFGCMNSCYVLVEFNPNPCALYEVTTLPKDNVCDLWLSLDKEINQKLVQGTLGI